MISRVASFIVCVCLVLGAICAKADIVVTDYLGRTVTLNKPAKRIVALAPHIVENIYSAGAGETIVGVVGYSDFPEAAKTLPIVGAVSSFSLEAIVNLNPDLVVLWLAAGGERVLHKLKNLNLQVYVSDPHTVGDVANSIRDFGTLADSTHIAEPMAQAYEQRYLTLSARYRHKSKLSVFYQVWDSPIQTINDKSIISDVIRLCGGTNAFGDAVPAAPKLSIESVIARNPQVIVASGMGEEQPDWLTTWDKWPSIQAVKTKSLYFIPPDIIQRHTTRMLDGAALMCEHLEAARANYNQ